jgi:hypothetical protein
MLGILEIFAWAGGTLLTAAVAVAGWEQWRQGRLPAPPTTPAAPRAVSVDVNVDALLEQPLGDRHERISTFDTAMDRMSSGPGAGLQAPPGTAWIETRPMVSLGPVVEPESHH